jgi:hypothetical protein
VVVDRIGRLFRGRWLLVTLPICAVGGWVIGRVLPDSAFLVLIVLAFPMLWWMGTSTAKQQGYWQAHMEIAQIMERVVNQEGKTDSELLVELVNGIAFQTLVAPRARRGWRPWRRQR